MRFALHFAAIFALLSETRGDAQDLTYRSWIDLTQGFCKSQTATEDPPPVETTGTTDGTSTTSSETSTTTGDPGVTTTGGDCLFAMSGDCSSSPTPVPINPPPPSTPPESSPSSSPSSSPLPTGCAYRELLGWASGSSPGWTVILCSGDEPTATPTSSGCADGEICGWIY